MLLLFGQVKGYVVASTIEGLLRLLWRNGARTAEDDNG